MLDGIRPNVRVRSRSPAEVSFCALRYRRRSLAMVVPDLPDLHRVIWSRSRSRIVRRGVLDHSLGSCGWPAHLTLCGIAQVRVRLSEAQETMLVTLCGRAWDARARQPILGDTMAAAAVEQMDYDFRRAKVNPRVAASVAVRAKQFDDWTAEFLAVHDQAIVVHLADLDTTCRHTGQPCDRLRVGARRASRDP
jgi:hypothetical protein